MSEWQNGDSACAARAALPRASVADDGETLQVSAITLYASPLQSLNAMPEKRTKLADMPKGILPS